MKTLIAIYLMILLSINISTAGPKWILFDSTNSPMEVNPVNNVYVDKNDNVYFTTAGYDKDSIYRANFYKYKNGKFTVYNPHKYLKGYVNLINDILVDPEGNPWIARSSICIGKYENHQWKQFRIDTNGSPNKETLNDIRKLEIDSLNQIYVASLTGIYKIDLNMNFIPPVYSYPERNNKRFFLRDMILDKNQYVWIITSAIFGNTLFKTKQKEYKRYNFDNIEQLKGFTMINMVLDSNNTLWLYAFNYNSKKAIMLHFFNNRFHIIDTNITKLHSNFLIPLGTDRFNFIWFSYVLNRKETGLVIYDGQNWRINYFSELGLNKDRIVIYSISFDSFDNIWLGTNVGLLVLGRTDDGVILDVKSNSTLSGNITISPNPATDYIDISGDIAGEIKVYDVLGVCILSQGDSRFRGNDMQISDEGLIRVDVSGLAAGVYFVRVGEKVLKFVKI